MKLDPTIVIDGYWGLVT